MTDEDAIERARELRPYQAFGQMWYAMRVHIQPERSVIDEVITVDFRDEHRPTVQRQTSHEFNFGR